MASTFGDLFRIGFGFEDLVDVEDLEDLGCTDILVDNQFYCQGFFWDI